MQFRKLKVRNVGYVVEAHAIRISIQTDKNRRSEWLPADGTGTAAKQRGLGIPRGSLGKIEYALPVLLGSPVDHHICSSATDWAGRTGNLQFIPTQGHGVL